MSRGNSGNLLPVKWSVFDSQQSQVLLSSQARLPQLCGNQASAEVSAGVLNLWNKAIGA